MVYDTLPKSGQLVTNLVPTRVTWSPLQHAVVKASVWAGVIEQ